MPERATLGALEELVLLVVRRLGEGADGARVREDLERTGARRVTLSTIYVTLLRLEEKGFVSSWKGESTPTRGGKARRRYAATEEGLAALETLREARDRLWADADPEGSRA